MADTAVFVYYFTGPQCPHSVCWVSGSSIGYYRLACLTLLSGLGLNGELQYFPTYIGISYLYVPVDS